MNEIFVHLEVSDTVEQNQNFITCVFEKNILIKTGTAVLQEEKYSRKRSLYLDRKSKGRLY